MNMRNRAFTLIELLVVIAIIAVLASIALPAYRGVQERANGIKDSNNLRQLGIGLTAYLGDHDDSMFSTANTTGSNSWSTQLGPNGAAKYVGDWHSFISPFDKGAGRGAADGTTVSYGINAVILSSTITSTTSYNHPSELMVFGPNVSGTTNALVFTGNTSSNSIVGNTSGGANIPGVMNNGSNVNVAFEDGHVLTMRAQDFNNSQYNQSTNGNLSQFWNPAAQ